VFQITHPSVFFQAQTTTTITSVNTRSRPAAPRLNFPRPVIAKTPKLPSCKPATGTTSRRTARTTALPYTSNHPYTPRNRPRCLDSSARSSPFPSVSSQQRARKQKRSQGGIAGAERKKGDVQWKRRGADDDFNCSSAHVAVLHRRYDTLRSDQPTWMRARARRQLILRRKGS
jgi:hypothetical protein